MRTVAESIKNIKTVLSCCLNVIDSLPASQRDKLLSPNIKANTNLTTDTVANLLADEVVALIFAAWAPTDPIIEDSIGLDLIQLADLTTTSLPLPPQTITFTPEGIQVVVDSLSKDVEFKQLRGYINEDEDSLYHHNLEYLPRN